MGQSTLHIARAQSHHVALYGRVYVLWPFQILSMLFIWCIMVFMVYID